MQCCAPDDPAGFRHSRLPKILAEIHVVCNNSKLDSDRLFPAGRPKAKRGQAPRERQRLGFRKVRDEDDGSPKSLKTTIFMSASSLATLSATPVPREYGVHVTSWRPHGPCYAGAAKRCEW